MLNHPGKMSKLSTHGADYFSFALVGLAINSYLKAGLVNITNDIRQIMDQGILEAICATPIKYTTLLLYSSLWQFTFETIRAISYFVIAIVIFGMRLNHVNWLGTIISLFLTILIFLMLGIISCSILIIVKRGDPINWILSGFSSLLAGTMFPIAVLPPLLQIAARCLPLTHSLEAIRKCLLAGADTKTVLVNILALLGFVILLMPLTILITNICMKLARKRGAFATH